MGEICNRHFWVVWFVAAVQAHASQKQHEAIKWSKKLRPIVLGVLQFNTLQSEHCCYKCFSSSNWTGKDHTHVFIFLFFCFYFPQTAEIALSRKLESICLYFCFWHFSQGLPWACKCIYVFATSCVCVSVHMFVTACICVLKDLALGCHKFSLSWFLEASHIWTFVSAETHKI